MPRFYEPDLGADPDGPFARDASNKLVRRSYWLDMNDRTLVMVMVNGIGAHLTNDEKRAHLIDLKCGHLIEQVCVQETLPPEKEYRFLQLHRVQVYPRVTAFGDSRVYVWPLTEYVIALVRRRPEPCGRLIWTSRIAERLLQRLRLAAPWPPGNLDQHDAGRVQILITTHRAAPRRESSEGLPAKMHPSGPVRLPDCPENRYHPLQVQGSSGVSRLKSLLDS
jgi:hypothetical protein